MTRIRVWPVAIFAALTLALVGFIVVVGYSGVSTSAKIGLHGGDRRRI
jgi:hypothetical protein